MGNGVHLLHSEGPRNIYVDGVSNVRDLGGYVTESGNRVKQGLLYRGGRLNGTWSSTLQFDITEAGLDTMINQLHIKTEIDLRGDTSSGVENGHMNNEAIPEIEYFFSPCTWSVGASGAKLYAPNKAEVLRVFEEVLGKEESYPVYFHCNIGTDRTGMIAYLVNGLLGVSQDDLYRDYLLSNFGNIGSSRSISGDMQEYVRLIAACEGDTYSQKVENFLLNDVGVKQETLNAIRSILLDD